MSRKDNQDMLAGSFILGQIVVGSYLTVIFHSRSTETSLNGWTVLTDVTIIRLQFATLMVGFTAVLLGISNLMPSCHSFKFWWGMPIPQRDIWDNVDTLNTSLDSCVIESRWVMFVIRFRAIRQHLITQMHLLFQFLKCNQLMLRCISTRAIQA